MLSASNAFHTQICVGNVVLSAVILLLLLFMIWRWPQLNEDLANENRRLLERIKSLEKKMDSIIDDDYPSSGKPDSPSSGRSPH